MDLRQRRLVTLRLSQCPMMSMDANKWHPCSSSQRFWVTLAVLPENNVAMVVLYVKMTPQWCGNCVRSGGGITGGNHSD